MAANITFLECDTAPEINENFLRVKALINAISAEFATRVTVTFDSDGGSDIDSQIIMPNTTALRPVAPTKEDYTFLGWFNGESETAFDFSTAITANTTLTAHWEAE